MERSHYGRWKAHSASVRVSNGLIAYYNFEDGIGTTNLTNLAAGDLENYVPRDGDATLVGGLTLRRDASRWPSQGKGGMYPTGVTTAYLDAPNFNYPDDGRQPITVMCWIKLKTSDVDNYYWWDLGKRAWPTHTGTAIGWTAPPTLYCDHGNGGGSGRITTSYGPYLDKWTHYVYVSNGSGSPGSMAIYINGKSITSGGASDRPGGDLVGLQVGASAGQSTGSKVMIDEFMIFNRVLSASEISAHYKNGQP